MGKTKAELIEEAKAAELELSGDETVAELEAKLKAKVDLPAKTPGSSTHNIPLSAIEGEDGQAGTLMRTKLNRGSTRRIVRALSKFQKDMDETIKELNHHAYIAGEDGERVADWPVVKEMRDFRQYVTDQVNAILKA